MGMAAWAMALLCLLAAGRPATGDAKDEFEKLLGARVREITRTRSTDDDVKLAAMLFETAENITGKKDLKLLLYEKAVVFGGRGLGGCETALRALDRLTEALPDRKAEWQARRLAVCRFRYHRTKGPARVAATKAYLGALIASGDMDVAGGRARDGLARYRQALVLAGAVRSKRRSEITSKIKTAGARAALERRRDVLAGMLANDPKNVEARMALIRFELVELDAPDRAAKLVTADLDAFHRRHVPLAAQAVDQVAADDCFELGRWFERLIETASSAGQTNARRRAAMYYERFLSLHKARDLNGVRAEVALVRLKAELAASGGKPTAGKVKKGKLTWVSKDATYKVSSSYPLRPPLPSFLTGTGKLHDDSTAFHTAAETHPRVTVILKQPATIWRIVIENRRGGDFVGGGKLAQRVKGLTVLASLDGAHWKRIWQATKARETWTIDLKKPVRAQYIRITRSAKRKTYLHLAGVKIYATSME